MDKNYVSNVGTYMTFEESIPLAKQLAENQLKKGFDVEAFLILASMKQIDAIPESNVDEQISDIGKMFIDYYYNPTDEALEKLLQSLTRAVSEVYHTLTTEHQKERFKAEIARLNSHF